MQQPILILYLMPQQTTSHIARHYLYLDTNPIDKPSQSGKNEQAMVTQREFTPLPCQKSQDLVKISRRLV